jgi:hypothetical protein
LKFKINHLPEGTTLLIHWIGISTVSSRKKLYQILLKKASTSGVWPRISSIDIGSPLNQQRQR